MQLPFDIVLVGEKSGWVRVQSTLESNCQNKERYKMIDCNSNT